MKLEMNFEDERQEFKSSLSQLDNGIDSLAAMLNKHCDGSIYFGVANSGEIVGLTGQQGEETIKKISERISLMIKPSVIPEIAFVKYDNKTIIKVSARGNKRPYSSNGSYRIRVGSENKQVEPDLLADLFFSSDSASIEKMEALNQNMSFNQLKQMFINKGFTINDSNFYENMHFLVNGKFNYLANLLADENDISIKVVRFDGLNKLKMLSRNEYGFKCLLVSMHQAMDYVKSLNETRVDIESGFQRVETHLFDQHAFDEAWINACLHNRWIRNVPPAIYIFDNRIEIISTGGLPFDYPVENFYQGISHPINPGLQQIMGQLGIIEQTGHGNLIIVEKYGKQAFTIGNNYIIVTIPFAFVPSMKTINAEGLSPVQKKLLEIIKNNPTATINDLCVIANLKPTRINELLSDLKKLNKIERVGANKNGYWAVKD